MWYLPAITSLPQPSQSDGAKARPSLVARLVARPSFWFLVVAIAMAIPLSGRLLAPPIPPLPIFGTLEAFSFTDQQERPFGSAELQGKVWVAGFIFTRCPTICPAVTRTMARMQKRAKNVTPMFRLVSFSVDPKYDTPEKLAAFAGKYHASPRLWKFLTGPLDKISHTVVDGLKIAMGPVEGDQDFASVMHGTHFVLVDQRLRVRGYYDSSEPDVVDRVLADATMLMNRGD